MRQVATVILGLVALTACREQHEIQVPNNVSCMPEEGVWTTDDLRYHLSEYGEWMTLLPLPCPNGTTDCPPGTMCTYVASQGEQSDGDFCVIASSDSVIDTSVLADDFGITHFEMTVEQEEGASYLRLRGLPAESAFVRCAFYGCAVDAETVMSAPERCLIDTAVGPTAPETRVPIPNTPQPYFHIFNLPLCDAVGPEGLLDLPVQDGYTYSLFIPTDYRAVCTTYSEVGLAGISQIVPLPPKVMELSVGRTFVNRCQDQSVNGRACLLDLTESATSVPQLGVCVDGRCCRSCVLGDECEDEYGVCRALPPVSGSGLNHMGYCYRDACVEPDGSVGCSWATLNGEDGPCVLPEDRDDDGFSPPLDCDDDDDSRHPGSQELPNDMVDQDCDRRVDEEPSTRCPDRPEMARLNYGTCIDRYEASRSDGEPGASPGARAMAYSDEGVLPWVDVSFETATRACELAGKRLCTLHEWFQACTYDSTTYSYGDQYEVGVCNDREEGADEVRPTGDHGNCAGTLGVFDLNGNVEEWVVSADSLEGPFVAGGSFTDPPEHTACGWITATVDEDWGSGEPQIGFRCCLDLFQ